MISMMQGVLGLASGTLVGFSLGLVSGGRSILAGSIFGKMLDGQKLLELFALLMLVIAALMLKTRAHWPARGEDGRVQHARHRRARSCDRNAIRFFRHRRRVPDRVGADAGDGNADHERGLLIAGRGHGVRPDHGCELCPVRVDLVGFGGLFIAGGIAGGLLGTRLARLASARRGALNIVFAVVIIAVALYMQARN
jgi:hypothetical protein